MLDANVYVFLGSLLGNRVGGSDIISFTMLKIHKILKNTFTYLPQT